MSFLRNRVVITVLLVWATGLRLDQGAVLVYGGEAAQRKQEAAGFQLGTDNPQIDRAYRLAVSVVEGNIKPWRHGLLRERRPVLMAGKGYGTPWTRDASYNTFFCAGLMYPAVAKSTLKSVLKKENGEVRIGGQYWDCISWVTGAWEYYLYTGDRVFLKLAYEAAVNTLRFFEAAELDEATGLFCGPGWSDGVAGYPAPYHETGGSSFILDYAKHNPDVDKIRMKAVSTNCLYCSAYRIAARMGVLLHQPFDETSGLVARSEMLRRAINEQLWLEDAGHYAYFLDVNGKPDPSQEGLGHAHAILFGIAGARRAERIFREQYVSPHGIPCTWPLFPRFKPPDVARHCGTVWPQIQGFWTLAAASQGKISIMDHEFHALTDMALASGDFREIYHPETGKPYGGIQTGRLWKSQPGQTWAATAYIGMLFKGVIGMRFDPQGIRFRPLVPERLTTIRLEHVTYRNAVIDIHIKGSGGQIERVMLDGKQIDQAFFDAGHQGRHVIVIFLGGR